MAMKDPLNKVVMEEIGLTVDETGKIMDQDTRERLVYKDRNMKYSSQNSVTLTNQDMLFDPISNKAVMSNLFDHFVSKIEEEDGIYVPMYYEIPSEEGTALEAVIDNSKKITTDYYNNESLKYLDMIQRLNGAEKIDLKQYDAASVKKDNVSTRRKRPRKKKIF